MYPILIIVASQLIHYVHKEQPMPHNFFLHLEKNIIILYKGLPNNAFPMHHHCQFL